MKLCLMFLSVAFLGAMAARLPQNDQNGSGQKRGTFACIVSITFAYSPWLFIDLVPGLQRNSVGKAMTRELGGLKPNELLD